MKSLETDSRRGHLNRFITNKKIELVKKNQNNKNNLPSVPWP